MAQSSRLKILYSAILNRNIVLVSHQDDDSDFNGVLNEIRGSLENDTKTFPMGRKFIYPLDNFQVHVLIERGIVFLCVTECTEVLYLPFSFLLKVKDEFSEQPSLISRSYHACEDELDRDFAPVLKSIMDYFNSGQGDQISHVTNQVEDVKQIMLQNVERIMERGERLEDLLSKTEDLDAEGREFRRQARVVHSQARWKNVKLWLVIVALVAISITLIVLYACGYLHS